MRSKATPVALALAALLCAGALNPSIHTDHTFTVPLSGGAEVRMVEAAGLAGDPDGSGLVRLTVNQDRTRICYDFAVSKLATPLMAHIHKGVERRNGPSVVTLFTGPGGDLKDCVTWTEKWLAAIVSDPSDFYVNFYTTEFPDGAVRGQL